MKLHRLLLVLAAIGLVGTLVGEVCAQGYRGLGGARLGAARLGGSRSGGSLYGYGRSPASLYSLGRLFVPPYYAIHPPVYYSLPQARPYGHSPFAYSGNHHPPMFVERRVVANPFIESVPLPEPAAAPAETATSTARVIANPYYSAANGAESSLASQTD